jgi:hypothetical protein
MLYSSGSLATLDTKTLEAPTTRMKNAMEVQNYFRRLIDNDAKRSYKRSRLNGLIDGMPPYKASKLREQGRADAANVNWGRARSYMESGAGSFYDLFSEAPGFVTVSTSYGTTEQRETWNSILSEEADFTLKHNPVWDYEMSISIDNLVLHGVGPLMFEDAYRCLPKAFLCGDLKVPEFTKSETSYWESCGVQATYYPAELYAFIQNEEYAKAVGWNVEQTRKVISNAIGIRNESGIMYEWEFYQAELKNNALSYYDESKICRLAHVFWREFDGRVTHAIVERDSASGLECKFLYLNIGRYSQFNNVIHPMYFDHGNGGYHHSVTGLGVKMFGAMEYENRLICNLADKAFSPKMLFKPTTADATQKIQLARFGEYGVLPRGTEAVQTPVSGIMGESMEMYGLVKDLNQDVLGSYRQAAPTSNTSGNPATKYQRMMEASVMSGISKTQFNRFYVQLDQLYAEIFRRMTNLNSTCPIAKEFQERCEKRGVPKEAMQRTDYVQATRAVGQGNGFMRKQAIDAVFTVAGALPEDGRSNLIRDKIAAEAGQNAVNRYYPQKQQPMPSDQEMEAKVQVGIMKIGQPSTVTSSQNPVIYATIFVQAATQALQSLQKGGDPHDVLRFLSLDGPAIMAHLKRFEQDPTRQQIYKALSQQAQKIGQATDQLKQQLTQQAKQQQAQQQKTQGAMTDAQLKQAKTQHDIQLKTVKTQAQLKQSEEKHRLKVAHEMQDLQINDAKAASEIHINRLKAFSDNGSSDE